MKKKLAISFYLLLLTVSIGLNMYLFKESLSVKEEIGSHRELTASNSRETITYMENFDLNEVSKTDKGKVLLQRLQHNLLYQLKSNYPEATDIL